MRRADLRGRWQRSRACYSRWSATSDRPGGSSRIRPRRSRSPSTPAPWTGSTALAGCSSTRPSATLSCASTRSPRPKGWTHLGDVWAVTAYGEVGHARRGPPRQHQPVRSPGSRHLPDDWPTPPRSPPNRVQEIPDANRRGGPDAFDVYLVLDNYTTHRIESPWMFRRVELGHLEGRGARGGAVMVVLFPLDGRAIVDRRVKPVLWGSAS